VGSPESGAAAQFQTFIGRGATIVMFGWSSFSASYAPGSADG